MGAPWGPRQPEPFFDKPMKLYQVALRKGLRSPFKPADELHPAEPEEKKPEPGEKKDGEAERHASKGKADARAVEAARDRPSTALAQRLYEVPLPAGDYRRSRREREGALLAGAGAGQRTDKQHLMALEIVRKDPKPVKVVEDVTSYELSQDGKKLLVRKTRRSLRASRPAPRRPAELGKSKVDLSGWSFPLDVREDWRQIFVDAWRLERDYFYDPGMHGVDWKAVLDKHLPLVDRVTTRDELSDLIGWMVGELSALHTSVRGGDLRQGPDDVKVPTLGARLARDAAAGGYRIEHIYRHDPDYPDERSPLARPRARASSRATSSRW